MLSDSAMDKRAQKPGLSCNECRRSKLKCDRVFPCQSCVRRGCADRCPNGTMTAVKGNKVLMAHAEYLSEKVKSMGSRIKELEAALADAQALEQALSQPPASSSASRHRLNSASLEIDDTSFDPEIQKVSDALGSLSIGIDGQTKFYGESAGSEYFHELLSDHNDNTRAGRERAPTRLGLPYPVLELVAAFPLGLEDGPYSKHLFVTYLPSHEQALELVDLYYKNAAWMYDPIACSDFADNILYPIYGTSGVANLDSIHPHRLSVFFIVLATGLLFDTSHASAALLAEQYHALSRASLSLGPILQEATCATVQALFLIVRFIYNTDRTQNEARWVIWGVCTRVAQIIGLQRDSAGWNLDPAEVQARRILCWELSTHDSWTSVVNGRPPSLSISHTDCLFPTDLDPFVKPTGETELGWHAWKFRYTATCLSISVAHVFKTKVPSYTSLLELDRRIRQFPQAGHLQSPSSTNEKNGDRMWSPNATKAMQQYCLVCERESTLLYIHRSYFSRAIREHSENPLQHEFAPSVLATCRSACRLIDSLRGLYAVHPALVERVWFFWSGFFSSMIVLGAIVVESPACSLSQNALLELNNAIPLYAEGSRLCRPPATDTVIKNLRDRAYASFTGHREGTPPASTETNAGPDVLAVLGGRKSVITKSPTHSPPETVPRSSASFDPPLGTEEYTRSNMSLMDIYDGQGERTAPLTTYDFYGQANYADRELHTSSSSLMSSKGKEPERAQTMAWERPYTESIATSYATAPHAQVYHPQPHPPQNPTQYEVTGPYSRQPMDLRPTYYAVAGGYTPSAQNQEEVWQEFVQHLGLQK